MLRDRGIVMARSALLLIGVGLLIWLFATSYLAAVILIAVVLDLIVLIAAVMGLLMSSLLFWLMLPRERKRYYRSHKVRLVLVVAVLVALCAAVALFTNRMFLPGRLDPISLAFDAFILILTVTAGWCILARRPVARVLVPGTLLLVIAIGALSFISPTTRSATDQADLDKLTALPYLTWAPDTDATQQYGVVLYDKDRAYEGINLYNPRNLPTAYLMDMSGNILHTWSTELNEGDTWVIVEMSPNGDLVAIIDEQKLLKLDWDSNLIWAKDIRVHHDLFLRRGGEIVVLTRNPLLYRVRGLPVMVIDEQITFLSASQEMTKQISFAQLLHGRVRAKTYWEQYRWLADPRKLGDAVSALTKDPYEVPKEDVFDFFHSNTLEIIDRNFDEIFREGNILFCVRNLDLVGVVDPTVDRLLWTWGPGHLDGPHHPTLLDNGNILIFDNGRHRKFSRVVELDPSTNQIVWEYRSTPPGDFFSLSRGGNQRLPNGNTLITNSDHGCVFEVTGDGEIVWEYLNPERRELSRATIYRFTRIPDPEHYPCLQRLK